jgi:hypothetical protein
VILIHPPVAKACEPPAGITKLAGFLRANGVDCLLLDANLEGTLYLLGKPLHPADTWTKRATRNLERNLHALRGWQLYESPDRYRRTVMDLNRVIAASGKQSHARISLSDFQHEKLSPLRSGDLLASADHPEGDPYYHYFSACLPPLIEKDADGVVGFSLTYLSQAIPAFAMIGFLKREFPALRLVLGGGLVTSWMRREGWSSPFTGLINDMVDGPGEYPLLRILGKSPLTLEVPAPRFLDLPMEQYLAPGPILPYATSSGCYWGCCSFCPETAEGNEYCPLAPDLVVEQLRSLAYEMKPALFHLVDNALSPAFMDCVARTVQAGEDGLGAPWYGFARITPHLADPDFCRALRASGCVMLKLGLESADQEVLDSMHKGHDVDVARLALTALKKAGIATYVYLLFGTPQETEAAARTTVQFLVNEGEHIDFLNLALFNLPIAAPEVRLLDTTPFYAGDLSLYTDFVHPRGWDRREVRQFLDREFKRHPVVQGILNRHPLFFTSNHAPFFASARVRSGGVLDSRAGYV